MAKDSFKVKKSLNIKPTDPATLSNSEVGDIVIDSTDNNKLKTYNDSSSSFVSVSSVGSLDTLLAEDFETTLAADFISGNAASPDTVPTGSFGGTLADETSNQLSGVRSLKYTMNATSASSDNDFFLNDTDIALAVKQRGNFIGINFYYTYNGDDDDIRFFVLDQDDNELTQSDEYIKSASTATRFSTSLFVPSDDTALRYGFQVVTGNSSKVFIVDDIEFSTNPFVYKNLAEENVYSARIANNGTATVTSQNQSWVDSVSRTAAGLVVVNYSSLGLTETPSLQVIPEISNIAQFTAHVDAISTTSATIRIGFDNGTDLDTDFSITLQKQGADYKAPAEHVVTPAKVVDEYYRARAVASGSTNTAIPYWSSDIVDQTGDLISIASSATDGMSITALKDVVITASYSIRSGTNGGQNLGWSLNSNQLSTNITTITSADRLKYTGNTSTPSESYTHDCSVQIKLSAGDVLRPHTGGTITSADASNSFVNVLARAANAEFLAAVPVPLVAYIDVDNTNYRYAVAATTSYKTISLVSTSGDDSFVSISSNQLTLGPGKYAYEIGIGNLDGQTSSFRLYDATNNTTYEEMTGVTYSDAISYSIVTVMGEIKITSSTAFKFQMKANSTAGTEAATRIKITKIK